MKPKFDPDVCTICGSRLKPRPVGRPSLISKYKEEVLLLYRDLNIIRRVAKKLPISYSTTWKIIKKYGVKKNG